MKRFLLLLVCVPFWYGSADAEVSITPSTPPVVNVGTTYQFSASGGTVTWSLASGSAGSINPSTGLYTAPSTITPKNVRAGCQLLPNDHVFNTRIDALPKHASSDTWMATIPDIGATIQPSFGLTTITNATPSESMVFLYTPSNNGSFQLAAAPDLWRENGYYTSPLAEVDRHLTEINRETCTLTDIYNNYPAGTQGESCPTCTAQSGVSYSANSYDLPASGGTDAASMFLQPLILTLADMRQAEITHAMRVTLSNNYIDNTFVWPAMANAGAWGSIPYGSRLRLKSSVNISGYSALAQKVLLAWKRYGLIVSDGGTTWGVQSDMDVTQDESVRTTLQGFGAIRTADWEIVDESSLMVSSTSGRVNPSNGYVTPSDYAVVVATNTENAEDTASMAVSLRAVVVGSDDPAIWVQSGSTYTLPVWVTGATNTAVTWATSAGSITSGGVLTPPTVSEPTAITVTATSQADSTAVRDYGVTVMPAGPIRIDAGSSSNFTGSAGTWWKDQASIGTYNHFDCSYLGQNPWPQDYTDIGLFYWQNASINDWRYRFHLANGTYKITALFGECGETLPNPQRVFHLEVNGVRKVTDYNPDAAAGAASTPTTVEIAGVAVSDQKIDFTIRRLVYATYANNPAGPMLSGLLIEQTGPYPTSIRGRSVRKGP
jgi:hypothetical protein